MMSHFKQTTFFTFFLTLVAALATTVVTGQTPVANLSCGYSYGNTPSPSWSSISGGSGTIVIDSGSSIDNQTYMNNELPAGFTFDFNGTIYTSFNISANGFIFFGNTDPGNINNPISNSTTAYEGAIAALGADIQAHDIASTSPQLLVQYSGTAPNRIATIEWKSFKPQGNTGGFCGGFFGPGNKYDFQIKLYENGGDNSNVIDIIHKDQNPVCIDSNGLSAQVGLRGATNSDFKNRQFSGGTTNNNNTSEGTSNTATITHGNVGYFSSNTRMRYTPKIQPAAISGEAEVCLADGAFTLAEANNNSISGASYQWYASPANTPISGATSSTYSANPGLGTYSYYVVVSNADGCVRVSEPFTLVVTDCGSTAITVTATAGSGGTISPDGTSSYNAGDTPTFVFTPECGYEVASVTVNGTLVANASSYTFSPLAGSATISVTFSLKVEVCNGLDDDCDGTVDNVENLSECQQCIDGVLVVDGGTIWYADLDGDGHGDINNWIEDCEQPDGYVLDNLDCDDTDQLIWLAKPIQIVLNLNPNHACTTDAPFQLGDVEPGNGTWSGTAVSNGMFNPATAGVGSHTVVYFVQGDGQCNLSASASAPLVVEICDGIDEVNASSFQLYPTQTTGIVRVLGQNLVSASIMDMNGRLIETVSLLNQDNIDMTGYASGIYLVRVNAEKKFEIHKVIKVD